MLKMLFFESGFLKMLKESFEFMLAIL